MTFDILPSQVTVGTVRWVEAEDAGYTTGVACKEKVHSALARGLGLFLQGVTVFDDIFLGPLAENNGCYDWSA